jgi:hypothetical protein
MHYLSPLNQSSQSKILEEIDRITEPSVMSQGEALEFLERLSTEIETRIDGIKDDMRAKGQDWDWGSAVDS